MNPLLGRWISADPLAVHAPGEADFNVYAYVRGSVLMNVDPLGLEDYSMVPDFIGNGVEGVGGVEALEAHAQESEWGGAGEAWTNSDAPGDVALPADGITGEAPPSQADAIVAGLESGLQRANIELAKENSPSSAAEYEQLNERKQAEIEEDCGASCAEYPSSYAVPAAAVPIIMQALKAYAESKATGRGKGGVKAGGASTKAAPRAAPGTKSVPNPYGKKGGPEHQAKVAEVAADIRSRGLEADFEHKVSTPGGNKETRFIDVVGKDSHGNVVEMHQVGRQTKGERPVSRERKALDDIERATKTRPNFHAYN